MDLKKALAPVLVYILLLAIFWLGYFTPRDEFLKVFLMYLLAFAAYAILYWRKSFGSLKMILFIGAILRIALFFSEPSFSDDHHRFIWDGVIVAEGGDPYATKPNELDLDESADALTDDLLADMNSEGFYSVYPPALQYIFGLSARVSNGDRHVSVLILRVFILIAELVSIWLIYALLKAWNKPTERTILYAFNPLVIVELTGNLHAEAYMICFTLLMFYMFSKQKHWVAAIAAGLAVSIKLIPLIFLPFLVKRLGWKKSIPFLLLTIGIALIATAPFWSTHFLGNFFSSVRLYFAHFEYNSSIYAVLRYLFGPTFLSDWYIVPVLTFAGLSILFIEDLLSKEENRFEQLPKVFLLALGVYLLFASTVHPWYVAPLVAFCLFTPYRWPIIWSALLPLTYITYNTLPWHQNYWVILFEYFVVIGFMFAEMNSYVKWAWWSRFKAQSKSKSFIQWIEPGERILEVGCGNGALTKLLRENGHRVEALDIKDRSHFEDVQPILANGVSMPFNNRSFDLVQLVTMLHHTPDPDSVIAESCRIGKRLLIVEDVYSGVFQKYLTYFVDSLANMEFVGHPHTNRTNTEWLKTFERIGAKVIESRSERRFLFFRQNSYLLQCN